MELIVLVNERGIPIGAAEKLPSHHGATPLHLAFSCYVFNNEGKFLVTQRAHGKKVWPGVWTNSVCGHPMPDEPIEKAIYRRMDYELGMHGHDAQVLVPDYTYKTPPFRGIIEHEYCPIYIARAGSRPMPNPEEVGHYKWMDWSDYVQALESDKGDTYSWWSKDQLKHIKDHPLIKEFSKPKNQVVS